jgi:hypothetical protein
MHALIPRSLTPINFLLPKSWSAAQYIPDVEPNHGPAYGHEFVVKARLRGKCISPRFSQATFWGCWFRAVVFSVLSSLGFHFIGYPFQLIMYENEKCHGLYAEMGAVAAPVLSFVLLHSSEVST